MDKLQAADAITKLAKQYQQMTEAAALLTQIGSLEQATKENKRQAEEAKAEADKAKADAKKFKDQLASLQKTADETVAQARKDAVAAGEEIVKDAQIQAAELMKKAQDEAAKLVAQAAGEKARMSSEVAGLQRAVIDLKGEIEALIKVKQDADTQAAEATKKLDALKSKLKTFLE